MAYPPLKDQFFLRPFYVFSTSFLRNRYYEVCELHTMHILPGYSPYVALQNYNKICGCAKKRVTLHVLKVTLTEIV